jgi:hypothetical protein
MIDENEDEVLTGEDAKEVEGTPETRPAVATENNSQQQPKPKKKKTKGPYATNGIFSRSPWRALAKTGEDMKKLGQTKRMLYERFRPRDPFEEFVLDRAWCCILRIALIGRVEEKIFAAGDKSSEERVQDIAMFAMASGSSKVSAEHTSGGLLNELSSVLRYDAYYAREFLRWIGILEALQNGERDGIVFQLNKKLGNSKDEEN